jgi:hypothetical protein
MTSLGPQRERSRPERRAPARAALRGDAHPRPRPGRQANALRPRNLAPPRAEPAETAPPIPDKARKPGKAPLPITILFICLVLPWQIYLGPLHLSPSRIWLTIMVVPCLYMWATGKAGRIRVPDVAILVFVLWAAIALSVVQGVDYALKSSGMLLIETVGGYMLARCFIRSAADFEGMARVYFRVMIFLLPCAIYEARTGTNLLFTILGAVWPTYQEIPEELRLGMTRVKGPFQHSILFGVFCGGAFALTFLVHGYGKRVPIRVASAALVALTASLSLSAGPMSAVATQLFIMVWDRVFRAFSGRWTLLWTLMACFYGVLSIFAKRPLAAILIDMIAFNRGNAWQRLMIWDYGTATILAHPLFGIGFGEMERPSWLTSTVDMFWIIAAMRYGLPGAALMGTCFIGTIVIAARRKGLSEQLRRYRLAYLAVMAGFVVVGWTVDFWAEVYVTFMFLVGSGTWLADAPAEEPTAQKPAIRTPACRQTIRRSAPKEEIA